MKFLTTAIFFLLLASSEGEQFLRGLRKMAGGDKGEDGGPRVPPGCAREGAPCNILADPDPCVVDGCPAMTCNQVEQDNDIGACELVN
uniref:Uncharacterized protein n=1 Tax=Pseudictyota dubia TaxID=2749911 RepID=A0A7R9WHW6_9STRA